MPVFLKKLTIAIMVVPLLAITGCSISDSGDRSDAGSRPFIPEISINEIMVGQVDHAANFILDLGADENQQLLENAWAEVEHAAIQLISSTSAITLGGTGEFDAYWASQPNWRLYVEELNNAAVSALHAARQQDLISIQIAGEEMVSACNGCHRRFKPEVPTQGYYRKHF